MLSNPCIVMTFFVIRFRKGECDPSLLLVIRSKRFISLHSTKLSLSNMGRYTTDSETSVHKLFGHHNCTLLHINYYPSHRPPGCIKIETCRIIHPLLNLLTLELFSLFLLYSSFTFFHNGSTCIIYRETYHGS